MVVPYLRVKCILYFLQSIKRFRVIALFLAIAQCVYGFLDAITSLSKNFSHAKMFHLFFNDRCNKNLSPIYQAFRCCQLAIFVNFIGNIDFWGDALSNIQVILLKSVFNDVLDFFLADLRLADGMDILLFPSFNFDLFTLLV